MFCTACGEKIAEGSMFCTACGQKMEVTASMASTPQKVVQPQKPTAAKSAPKQETKKSKAVSTKSGNKSKKGAVACAIVITMLLTFVGTYIFLDMYYSGQIRELKQIVSSMSEPEASENFK